MANQSPDRRQVLEMLAKVAAASQFPGFARWAYAGQSDVHTEHAPAPAQQYAPQFFTPAQYAVVDRVTEMILPADDTPGAHEAGVAEFVDFMAASDAQIQERFRTGIAWLGDDFMRLDEAGQTARLRTAASAPRDSEGGKFFRLIREYTVMGYYTSRIGLQQLDYPGLRMYAQSPACPHKGNPEHLRLNGAGV